MKTTALLVLAGLCMTAPAFAQDWGSTYNMGSIGVSGGNEASGSIVIDCAESGNAVVKQGAFAIFLKPSAQSSIGEASPGDLTFSIDGTDVVVPVSDNKGDGFVYDKTPETLSEATRLVELLKSGKELVVTGAESEIARIDLDGAGLVLEGVEVCLAE